MEAVHNIVDIIKMLLLVFVPVIGYYLRNIASSIKSMESDISGIKTHIEVSKVEKNNLEIRLSKVETKVESMDIRTNEFWKKYSHALETMVKQDEKK